MCIPDVFSIRNSSVPAYLEPIVHEIKVSRADVLGDLKNKDKRDAYLDLGGQCWYVLGCNAKGKPIAESDEIPIVFLEIGERQRWDLRLCWLAYRQLCPCAVQWIHVCSGPVAQCARSPELPSNLIQKATREQHHLHRRPGRHCYRCPVILRLTVSPCQVNLNTTRQRLNGCQAPSQQRCERIAFA
jgi:hypothetical protein